MAHVERPTYTRSLPKSAKVVGTAVTWVGRGNKPVRGTLLPSGKVRVVVAGSWVGVYTDHHGKRCKTVTFSSRTTAMEAAISHERHAQAVREGRLPQPGELASQHFIDHVAGYAAHLREKGRTEKHIDNVERMLREIIAKGGLTTINRVDCEQLQAWLERHRRTRGGQTGTVTPFTLGWLNHHVVALKGFGSWLVRKKAASANPFAGLQTRNVESTRSFERRALTVEDLARLISTTRASEVTHHLLDGPTRSLIYQLAAYTGLRLGAIRQLTRDNFAWVDGRPLAVYAQAKIQKNRKQQGIPLQEDLSVRLAEWIGDREGALFGGGWHWKAAQMLAEDLKAAGIDPVTSAGVFDFHALRLQFGVLCAIGGVPLVAAQQLLGHSTPKLTANIYSKLGGELGSEIRKLPSLGLNLGPDPEKT